VNLGERHLAREAYRRLVPQVGRVEMIDRIPEMRARLRAELFPQQLAFFEDKASLKAALCTRRAGKTTETAPDLVDGALDSPGAKSLYVTLTRERAKELLWDELKALDHRHQIGMKPNEVELSMRLPEGLGGGIIKLTGADKAKEIEKRRGDKYRRVRIDEAQAFGDYLRTFVSDVLEPALMDLRGDLGLLGTPGVVCAGLFYEVTRNEDAGSIAKRKPGWSVHSWSVLDNPFLPHAREWLEAKRAEHGWTEDNPTYLREWCGRWVNDTSALFYKFDPLRNTYAELPKGHRWEYVFGIDLGYDDAFAIVVWAFSRTCPVLFEVETFKASGLTPSDWADEIRSRREKYRPIKMKVDQGGLGKAFAEEMRTRHGLPLEPAEKTEKATFVELMNDDLLAGRIKVKADSALAQEWRFLPRDPEDPRKEDPRFANHASDGGLYGWREARHFLGREVAALPLIGSREWAEAEARRHEDALEQRLSRQARWGDDFPNFGDADE
jgi:hypothetical protein